MHREQTPIISRTAGKVIKAWDVGVATMKKGEKAKFVCRSDYACVPEILS